MPGRIVLRDLRDGTAMWPAAIAATSAATVCRCPVVIDAPWITSSNSTNPVTPAKKAPRPIAGHERIVVVVGQRQRAFAFDQEREAGGLDLRPHSRADRHRLGGVRQVRLVDHLVAQPRGEDRVERDPVAERDGRAEILRARLRSDRSDRQRRQ